MFAWVHLPHHCTQKKRTSFCMIIGYDINTYLCIKKSDVKKRDFFGDYLLVYTLSKASRDLSIQSDLKSIFWSLIINQILSSVVSVFLLSMDEIVVISLLHLWEMNISSQLTDNLLRWNNELRILSNFFSQNISNSWNHQ